MSPPDKIGNLPIVDWPWRCERPAGQCRCDRPAATGCARCYQLRMQAPCPPLSHSSRRDELRTTRRGNHRLCRPHWPGLGRALDEAPIVRRAGLRHVLGRGDPISRPTPTAPVTVFAMLPPRSGRLSDQRHRLGNCNRASQRASVGDSHLRRGQPLRPARSARLSLRDGHGDLAMLSAS